MRLWAVGVATSEVSRLSVKVVLDGSSSFKCKPTGLLASDHPVQRRSMTYPDKRKNRWQQAAEMTISGAFEADNVDQLVSSKLSR
jgi:hypothetical protein